MATTTACGTRTSQRLKVAMKFRAKAKNFCMDFDDDDSHGAMDFDLDQDGDDDSLGACDEEEDDLDLLPLAPPASSAEGLNLADFVKDETKKKRKLDKADRLHQKALAEMDDECPELAHLPEEDGAELQSAAVVDYTSFIQGFKCADSSTARAKLCQIHRSASSGAAPASDCQQQQQQQQQQHQLMDIFHDALRMFHSNTDRTALPLLLRMQCLQLHYLAPDSADHPPPALFDELFALIAFEPEPDVSHSAFFALAALVCGESVGNGLLPLLSYPQDSTTTRAHTSKCRIPTVLNSGSDLLKIFKSAWHLHGFHWDAVLPVDSDAAASSSSHMLKMVPVDNVEGGDNQSSAMNLSLVVRLFYVIICTSAREEKLDQAFALQLLSHVWRLAGDPWCRVKFADTGLLTQLSALLASLIDGLATFLHDKQTGRWQPIAPNAVLEAPVQHIDLTVGVMSCLNCPGMSSAVSAFLQAVSSQLLFQMLASVNQSQLQPEHRVSQRFEFEHGLQLLDALNPDVSTGPEAHAKAKAAQRLVTVQKCSALALLNNCIDSAAVNKDAGGFFQLMKAVEACRPTIKQAFNPVYRVLRSQVDRLGNKRAVLCPSAEGCDLLD